MTAKLVKEVMKRLKPLKPVLHKVALTGSTYIKFENPSIGSLRVADHPGRKKYAYRWNLFLNLPEDQRGMRVDRGIKRWYYDASQLDEFVSHITNYANKIERTQ